MKKIIKLFLICTLTLGMYACSAKKPKGTYADSIGFSTMTFDGNKVTMVSGLVTSNTTEGTFTIEGDTIKISWEDGGSDTLTYNSSKDTLSLEGALEYSKK